MKHSYSPDCPCARCERERTRRTKDRERTTPEVMLDWTTSRTQRRRAAATRYWDRFESGAPMSSDDY